MAEMARGAPWLANCPTTRSLARAFVRWAISHRHIPSLEFPHRVARTEPTITQQQRLEHITRLTLVRLAQMRLQQLNPTETTVTISFTDDTLTIPPPFDRVIREHLAALSNQTTSAHRENQWLFSGRRPGQHLHQSKLMNKLRDAGIDLRGARNASLRALVLELPAPVVADSLNCSYQVTDKHRQKAGATFIDLLSKRTPRP